MWHPVLLLSFGYLKLIPNALLLWTMSYGMPLFSVISTMIAINGDYKNGFFEIEKAGGVKPICYLSGRLAAIFTVNLAVLVLTSYTAVYTYCFTRGLADMTTLELLSDSIPRVFRQILICELPVVLFYIGLSCAVAALFKNGTFSVMLCAAYIVIMYSFRRSLSFSLGSNLFSRYFWPHKFYAYQYVNLYDTEYVNEPQLYGYMPYPIREVAMWATVFVLLAMILYTVCYICTRKRSI